MKSVFLLLFTNLLFLHVWAQNDYIPGLVVTNNGDTITGFVKVKKGFNAHSGVLFRSSPEENHIEYSPDQIVSYFVGTTGDRIFQTHEIVNDQQEKEKVFLEVISGWRAILYLLRTQIEPTQRYYAKKGDQPLIELRQIEEKKLTNDPTKSVQDEYTVTRKLYLGALNLYFSDCDKIQYSQIEKVNLRLKSLQSIFEAYNLCSEDFEFYESKSSKEKDQKEIFVRGGINIHTIKATENNPFFNDGDVQNGMSFGVGVILYPKFLGKFGFELGLEYNEKGSSSTTEEDTFMDLKYFNLRGGPRYTLGSGLIRPTFGAGGFIGFLLNNDDAFSISSEFFNRVSKDKEFGIYIDAGVRIVLKENNYLWLNGQYSSAAISTPFADYRFTNRVFHIQLGYILGF